MLTSIITIASTLTAAQCRAARALLRLRRDDLAKAAQVAPSTLFEFESGRRQPYPRTLAAIRAALEAAGAVFIDANGDGPGVRQRQDKG